MSFESSVHELKNKVRELLLLASELMDEEMYTMAVHNISLALYGFLESLHLELYGITPEPSKLKNLIVTLAPSENLERTLRRYVEENNELFEKLELAYKISLLSKEYSREEAQELLEFVNKTIRFLTELKSRIFKELSQ